MRSTGKDCTMCKTRAERHRQYVEPYARERGAPAHVEPAAFDKRQTAQQRHQYETHPREPCRSGTVVAHVLVVALKRRRHGHPDELRLTTTVRMDFVRVCLI